MHAKLAKLNGTFRVAALATGLSLWAGCYHDKPHEYGQQRPPVEDLDARDRGLQSKDVVAASDQMAQDLLAQVPQLNQTGHRWTIVVDRVDNHTTMNNFDLNIFLERLRVNLSKYGRSQIAIIENRDKYRDIQSRELEGGGTGGGGGDEFGQGGGGGGSRSASGSAGTQPDYGLYAKIIELPNRGTSYFLCEFTLTNLHTREQVWNNAYEVKVER
jgi:hypothetical protein